MLGVLPGLDAADLVGDTHGGLVETSQLLALHGEWIDPEYKSLPRLTVDTWLESQGRGRAGQKQRGGLFGFIDMLRSYRAGLEFFNENTYSGAPAGASPELGERILDTLARYAGEACGELLDGTIGPEDCHSPIWKLRFLFLNPIMIRLSNRLLGFRNAIA